VPIILVFWGWVLKLLVKWGRRRANFTSEIWTVGCPILLVFWGWVLKLLVKWGRCHANFTSEIWTGVPNITSVLGMGAKITSKMETLSC
jgi:hypothetical protein